MPDVTEHINEGQDWVEAYKELATMISSLEWCKWVDLWEEQPYFTEQDHAIPAPAVYLEFNSGEVNEKGDQGEIVYMEVTVYLYYLNISDSFHGSWNQDDALRFANLNKALHRLLKGKKGTSFSRLTRVSFGKLATPHAGGRLFQQTYRCLISDDTAVKKFTLDLGEEYELGIGRGPVQEGLPDNTKLYDLDGMV